MRISDWSSGVCSSDLNRPWRPQLAITGADGLPPLASAGNVLRPFTAVKLSLRIPPTLDGVKAGEALKKLLESDPPYGAKVTLELEKAGSGWNAPHLSKWHAHAAALASKHSISKPKMQERRGATEGDSSCR